MACGACGTSRGIKAAAVVAIFAEPRNYEDRWIPQAVISAGAANPMSFLIAAARARRRTRNSSRICALPCARWPSISPAATVAGRLGPVLDCLATGNPAVSEAALSGFMAGWPGSKPPELSQKMIDDLSQLMAHLGPEGRMEVVALGKRWKAGDKFNAAAGAIKKTLLAEVGDEKKSDAARLAAARQLASIGLDDDAAKALLDSISAKSSPDLVVGLLDAVGSSPAPAVGTAIVGHWSDFSPASRGTAVALLLSRKEWMAALLDGLEKNKIGPADLSLDQTQKLTQNSDAALAQRAQKILAQGGRLPNADRQRVVEEFKGLVDRRGDVGRGRTVFEQNCAKCHRHGSIGAKIGPDLTGIATHKRGDLLIRILDPNRGVEANYQQYNLTTDDGRTFIGLLVDDNRTSVEILDAEGKRHTVLRENIDSLVNTRRTLMPEGFEKLGADTINDLLEFLTAPGKYVPLRLEPVATITSVKGMFYNEDDEAERLVADDWEPKTVLGVPFHLTDPHGGHVKNVIMLYGPNGKFPPEMPKSVSLNCNLPAKAIHLLGGISGWGYPASKGQTVSLIVRLHYAGGVTEDIPLRNGVELADYIRRVDVPGSKLAFMAGHAQVRYLAVTPKRRDAIEQIEFVKGPDATAPVIMAVTIETGE